jgi:hypothetical protein
MSWALTRAGTSIFRTLEMTSGKLGRVKRLAALIGIFALGPIAHYLWLLLTVDDPRNIQQAIATSANVAWLERIAASAETAEGLLPKQELNYQPKDLRVAAYARLGELATAREYSRTEACGRRVARQASHPASCIARREMDAPGVALGRLSTARTCGDAS